MENETHQSLRLYRLFYSRLFHQLIEGVENLNFVGRFHLGEVYERPQEL